MRVFPSPIGNHAAFVSHVLAARMFGAIAEQHGNRQAANAKAAANSASSNTGTYCMICESIPGNLRASRALASLEHATTTAHTGTPGVDGSRGGQPPSRRYSWLRIPFLAPNLCVRNTLPQALIFKDPMKPLDRKPGAAVITADFTEFSRAPLLRRLLGFLAAGYIVAGPRIAFARLSTRSPHCHR